jgi:TonB-dependent starch-binding outer membrane protein SusC
MKKIRLIYLLILLLSIPWRGYSQADVVSGVVKDSKGEALPGVSIGVKGTSIGTTTDVDGKYSLRIADKEAILVFSYIGFTTEEIPLAGKTTINVDLVEDLKNLQEVVVVGYGATKKSDLTGAVTAIKGGDLNKVPSSSMDQLLQGKIPGVQVITSSGRPGAGAEVRIRGVSSLNGQKSPLVVVDGFPWGDAGDLKQINPDDIESIQVLKDASSAAIYGSRGANGVIMVTLKKGRSGKPRVSISTQNSLSTLAIQPDLWRDPVEEAIYANEAAINGGTPADQLPYIGTTRAGVYFPSVAELRGTDPNKPQWPHNTDWKKEVYRKAFTQNYTVGVDGGNEFTKYTISGNYYKEEGLNIKNFYDKYTGRLNLDQKISKALSMGTNLLLTYTKNAGRQLNADRSRIFPVYDENGNYFKSSPTDFGNPIAIADRVLDQTKTIDVLATVYANVKITDWLQFRSQLSSKYGNYVRDIYEPSSITFAGHENNGLGSIENFNNNELLNENYFTIDRTFADIHKLNVVGGFSIQKSLTRWSTLTGTGFPNDNLQNENLFSATVQRTNNRPTEESILESWYGRLNYVLKDKYLFTFTGRADGSTKFGNNNKWAFFPSGAVAWKLNEEEFIRNLGLFSELKVRASYGLTGNQGISPYQSLDRFGTGKYWNPLTSTFETGFGPGLAGESNQQGLKLVGGLQNNDLKWETTTSFDAGIDLGFLNQRFTLTADYYVKNTNDLLRIRSISPSTGYDEQWVNDGEISNKGIELGLNANIISSADLNWSVGFNYTRNRNEVVAMGESELVQTGDYVEQIRQNANYFIVGQPIYSFYGYKTDGIIQTEEEGIASGLTGVEALPGEIKYLDISGPDGTPDGVIDGLDRTVIGNPNPDFIYSFNTRVEYKNFDLSAQLYGVQGNDVMDLRKMTPSRQIQRWTLDNPSNEYPRANNSRGYKASDFFITDGSFLRIQNVTIGYNVKPNVIKGVSNLRIYLSGNNLYTFSKFNPGFDPEVAQNGIHWGGYPRPRAYTLGLNIGF